MQSSALAPTRASLTPQERGIVVTAPALQTLQEALTAVPDPRARHGRRYAFPFLLTCLVAALLCNGNSLAAVRQWCAAPALRHLTLTLLHRAGHTRMARARRSFAHPPAAALALLLPPLRLL